MNAKRLLTIAAHETRTLVKGPLFWALIFLIGLATSALNPTAVIPDGAADDPEPFINSVFAIASSFAMLTFFLYTFFAAIMAGLSIIRDDEQRITELLRATPMTSAEYVVGKFAGVMGALGLALVAHVMILLWFAQIAPAWNQNSVRGPFDLLNFIEPMLLFGLPSVTFSAGLAFAVGEWSRRPLVVYTVPTALFFVTVNLFNSMPLTGLSAFAEQALMVADPSGLRWLRQAVFSAGHDMTYYNTSSMPYDAVFWASRLVAFGLPALAVAFSVRHYSQHVLAVKPARRFRLSSLWQRRKAVVPAGKAARFGSLRDLGMMQEKPGFWASVWPVLKAELRELRAQPAVYLFGAVLLMTVLDFAMSSQVVGAPVRLTAGVLATETLSLVSYVLCLILLFVLVESVQRDRGARFDAILYAAPMRTSALLTGKALASSVLVGVILMACILLGAVLVAVRGAGVEVMPFLIVWGGIVTPTLFAWGAFSLLLVALFRNRYAAYAIGLLVLGLSLFAMLTGNTTWLTNWTVGSALRWSDLGVFEAHRTPLVLNRVLVVGLGGVLAVLAGWTFARTERDRTRTFDRLQPANLGRFALRLAPVALVPVLAGSYLALGIRAGHDGAAAEVFEDAYWQMNAETWSAIEPPARRHVDLSMTLRPEAGQADIAGEYTLVNEAGAPMQRLPFTVKRSFGTVAWSLEGEDIDVENRSGLHVLDLPAPLLAGDTVRVGFAYTGTYPDGFSKRGGGNEQFVLPSGTVLHTLRNDFLPVPGFVNSIGRPEDYEAPVDSSAQTAPPVLYTTEITVEAPSSYTVNALGNKVEEVVSDGQRTAVWRSDVPVSAINVLAGQWAVAERDGVAVYYHPEHGANVGRMLDALSGAREHYAEWFGPYPWSDLRLSEFPNEVTLAQGFATNISFSEGLGFLAGRTDVADPAFSVTAHEAAHQWWGNLISAAETPGADVLLESMAQYATLRLHETVRGDESRRQFARLMEASYAERRRTNEAPLAESGDVFTVLFDKGPWVLWMMDQHLGREAMSAGLRRFADTYAIHTAERRPTLDDFLVTMRGVASDSAGFEVFLDTWFDQVVLPEYTLSDFEVTEGPDGWQVTVEAENIGTGAVPVEIAVEADGETASTVHTLHPGQPETLTWTVPFEPARVVVDPGVHVLQRNRQRAMSR